MSFITSTRSTRSNIFVLVVVLSHILYSSQYCQSFVTPNFHSVEIGKRIDRGTSIGIFCRTKNCHDDTRRTMRDEFGVTERISYNVPLVSRFIVLSQCKKSNKPHHFAKNPQNDDDDDDNMIDSSSMELNKLDQDVSPQRRERKIRRKQVNVSNNISVNSMEQPIELVPVSIQVMDVRNIVQTQGMSSSTINSDGVSIENNNSKYNEKTTVPTITPSSTSLISKDNDSMAQLLADVQQMRADNIIQNSDIQESNLSIQKILSNIVIVDFFFVVVLFLWFILGILCSYGLHDDTVQIAFNGIFQPIVQPALGILMIASISDAILKKNDDAQQ